MEFMNAIEEKRMEEIYWVGGEPLMWDIHWNAMARIIDLKFSDRVNVRYNTNLSRITYKNKNLYDLLPNFKKVNICASMDATGEVAEYIRSGLKYNEWLINFKNGIFLNDLYGMDAMVLDVTLTLPGMLDMKNMIDLAVQLNVKSYVKITFDFESSAIMSPMCLPHNILDSILDDLIEYEKVKGNYLTNVYSETFNDMKNRQTFDQKYNDYQNGLKAGKSRYNKIDAHRKESDNLSTILSRDQHVLNWYNNI
jgi:hypothetical protein